MNLERQLQLKIKLENRFKPEIRKVFATILQDFRSSVAIKGVPPQSRRYSPAWNTIIDNHYRRAQKAFTGVATGEKKQRSEEDKDNKKELLALALLTWRDQNVPKHAEWLTTTTQFNMAEAIRLAREEFAADGKTPTNKELALAAVAILRKKFSSRLGSIAMSETQVASESTKFTDAEVESDLLPKILGGGLVVTTTIKTWMTMGDSKVRKIHAAINGQIQQLTQPYIVNNEFLMYPGDSSMGASADNTANCRCFSEFSF